MLPSIRTKEAKAAAEKLKWVMSQNLQQGQSQTRFRISLTNLKKVLGLKVISEADVEVIALHALLKGLILGKIDEANCFCIDMSIMGGWKRVPKWIVEGNETNPKPKKEKKKKGGK